jgi:flagellar motor component MotA
MSDEAVIILTCVVIFLFYILKDTPLGFLWRITRLFFIILFATLFANYAKDEIKKWWNS